MLMHKGTERLLTERLELRRFTMEDLEYMFTNWASDPEVARYITWPAHKDRDVTSDVMKRWMEHYPNPNFYQWAIVVKELNQPIGSISVVNSSEGNEHCEIGYCIGRAFWNKGYTTEALKCVMNFLFHEVGYERIEAQYQKDNLGSGMVMKKAGMSYEGIKRHAYKNRDDQFVDLVLYAKVKESTQKVDHHDKTEQAIHVVHVTEEIRQKIGIEYGKMQADHLHMETEAASFAAIKDEKIVGFISVYPKKMNEPLEFYDAYIDIIEVHEGFRKLGIASLLVHACETWAKTQGYRQMRAWSSLDKKAAISMWVNLGYGLCPAEMLVNQGQLIVKGYYVVKMLE